MPKARTSGLVNDEMKTKGSKKFLVSPAWTSLEEEADVQSENCSPLSLRHFLKMGTFALCMHCAFALTSPSCICIYLSHQNTLRDRNADSRTPDAEHLHHISESSCRDPSRPYAQYSFIPFINRDLSQSIFFLAEVDKPARSQARRLTDSTDPSSAYPYWSAASPHQA
jgi:hypothetical protein